MLRRLACAAAFLALLVWLPAEATSRVDPGEEELGFATADVQAGTDGVSTVAAKPRPQVTRHLRHRPRRSRRAPLPTGEPGTGLDRSGLARRVVTFSARPLLRSLPVLLLLQRQNE